MLLHRCPRTACCCLLPAGGEKELERTLRDSLPGKEAFSTVDGSTSQPEAQAEPTPSTPARSARGLAGATSATAGSGGTAAGSPASVSSKRPGAWEGLKSTREDGRIMGLVAWMKGGRINGPGSWIEALPVTRMACALCWSPQHLNPLSILYEPPTLKNCERPRRSVGHQPCRGGLSDRNVLRQPRGQRHRPKAEAL